MRAKRWRLLRHGGKRHEAPQHPSTQAPQPPHFGNTLISIGADEPPRYVPVSRIRSARKSANIQEREVAIGMPASTVTIDRLYRCESGAGAEMLTGSDDEVATQIVALLREKGVLT